MTHTPDNLLSQNIAAAAEQFRRLEALRGPLEAAVELVLECLTSGHKLLTCGNGGSASDAAHIATEFVCRYQDDRRPYPAICLTDAGSTLTAIGNDYAFQDVFSRQVRAFGRPGDVLIGISTSGNSPNIRAAIDAARAVGVKSIALLGKTGGSTKGIADIDLLVPGDVTARIQEAHKLLYHTLCEMVERKLPRE